MRIYIAGAWVEQHQRARPMIARVREAGLVVTCDWTQAEGDVCSCGHHRQEHGPFSVPDGYVAGTGTSTRCARCRDGCSAFNGIGIGGDSKLTDEARRTYAQLDLNGVLSADVFWLLASNTQGASGSWVELGAALASRQILRREVSDIYIIVSGPKNKRTIFTELADRLFETDEEALVWVLAEHAIGRAFTTGLPR